MRSVVHAVVLVTALVFVAPASGAQGARPNPLTGLVLTAEQRDGVRALTERTRTARRQVLGRQVSTQRISVEDRTTLDRLATQHNADFRALLTDAQRRRLDDNLTALRAWYVASNAAKRQGDK